MALKWHQEERFSAKGTTGNYYKVFPFMGGVGGKPKFGATVAFLNEDGEMETKPIGTQFDSIDEAKQACEEEYTKATKSA